MTAIITTAIALTACSKSLGDREHLPVAGIMAFNLTADKTNVGVSISGNNLVNMPLNFSGFTGGYLTIYPGNRSIVSFGATQDSLLSATQYSFETDNYYSVFVMGNKGVYKNVIARDKLDSLSAGPGKAFLRYVNAIPDSGKANLLIAAGGSPVINEGTRYGMVSSFVPVKPGQLQVSLTTVDSPLSANRNIRLEAGKAYTLLVVRLPATGDSTGVVQIRCIKNAG